MRMSSIIPKIVSAVAGVTALTLLAAHPASAQLVTFADFSFNPQSNTFYQFVNSGTGSVLQTRDTANTTNMVPVLFHFGTSNGYDTLRGTSVGTAISAYLTFTSTVNGSAVSAVGQTFQSLNNITMSFSAVTAEGGLTNLLSVTGSTGTLSAVTGGRVATVQASDNKSVATDNTVNFSSDFLSFTNANTQTINLSLNSLTSGFSTNANGYVNSFRASGQGNFASDPTPVNPILGRSSASSVLPEPGTLALMGLSLLCLPVTLPRKRRTGILTSQ